MNISITHKILTGFIIMTCLGILGNLFALLKFGNLAISTKEVAEVQDLVQIVNDLEETLKIERQMIQDFYDSPDSSVYNAFVYSSQSFNEKIAAFRFKAYWADEALQAALNKAVAAQNDLSARFNSVVFSSAFQKLPGIRKELGLHSARIDRALFELKHLLVQAVDTRISTMVDAGRFMNRLILVLLILTVLSSVLFCTWIIRSFLVPFRKLLWNIRLVGQGQFDQSLEITSSDEEVQQLIDAVRNMQIQLRKYRDNLIEAERLNAVNLLATSVSHEVNNPLMIISGTAEYIRTVKSGADDEIKEKMETITGEVQRISAITRKLTRIKQIILEDYSLKDNSAAAKGSLVDIESSAEGGKKK